MRTRLRYQPFQGASLLANGQGDAAKASPWTFRILRPLPLDPWGGGGEPVRPSAENGPEPVRLRFEPP